MPEPVRVVVVGGAVLDAKVRTAGEPVLGTSNPGTATSGVGGVGRNVAENLARLGSPTVLVAAVGDDVAGRTVRARTAAAGVDVDHLVTTGLPTGTYTAVLDHRGDLLLAVADMRATDELGTGDLAVVPALLAGAGLLVLDGNLDVTVLRALLREADEAGVPVVLEPVSVAKATAAAPALDDGRPVHTVTPNADELAALTGLPVPDSVADVRAAAEVLHARGVERVWVRRGARGSLLSVRTPDGPPRAVLVAAPTTDVVDVTGAGDAMTAGYVHSLLAGADVVEAARFGQVLAALTCASPDTVRPDLTAALVADRLTPTEPTTEELPG
ncbi:carbohydrate kinase family protein [Phycicoccus flavus]|uniref:Carbohydrate kinase n=1 Tax=Phycicoccus flavus TaxID=2502783 RepID=A0A8T6R1R6_9MICO|nr:carbohydrate kinase family protein [Phycicoccus flavus]NHA67573.1 carbohydrate kinase [Phycicoccus flavus]